MAKVYFLILIFFCFSCAHNFPSQDLLSFIDDFEEQFGPHDSKYFKIYERYLASVEKIYRDDLKLDQFKSYLDSLKNNQQILGQQKRVLPDYYEHKTGRKLASNMAKFEDFKTKEMTLLHDKLFQAREIKIKEEVGDKMYAVLKKNYSNFMETEKAQKLAFPL